MSVTFGEIENIQVGQIFDSRESLAKARIHTPPMGGIWGASEGACSIVLSGGYEDDIDDEREEREQRLKLRIARKVESFQGQSKVLSFQIDGEKGDIEVRNVVDIFDSPFITRLLRTLDKGILFLEDTHNMGRSLEFRYTIVKGDLVLEIREFVGEELIREQLINMDYHTSDAIDFVTEALKLATPETDEWWK